MIRRHCTKGQKLNVADLNEITVLARIFHTFPAIGVGTRD